MMTQTAAPPDFETGEVDPAAPTYAQALQRIADLETLVSKMEGELNGKRLRIAALETDREAEALEDPLRPEVELLHAVWLVACKRRRQLDFNDREQISRAIKRHKLPTCLRAIAGAAYDPGTRELRNGKTERYDDIELIFRRASKVTDFARRAPIGWEPDPERIAEIAEVDVEWVKERL